MTWFFAFVIVALMGVVAVVASGRGGSMAETYDDRPDSRVQADGPLTAADLRSVRFSTAFRGYRMSAVDSLLDRLAAEMTPVPEASAEAPLARHAEESTVPEPTEATAADEPATEEPVTDEPESVGQRAAPDAGPDPVREESPETAQVAPVDAPRHRDVLPSDHRRR
jgi:DivIVA domain-containing protein